MIVSRNYRHITDASVGTSYRPTSSHLCSLQLHSSASRPIMFVANSAWLLTRKRLTQIQLWSAVFQALPFHYSSEYKVGLHFLTQWRQSRHLLILGPKCLMHFSAELSETLRHWCRSVQWTLRHQCKNVRHFGTKHIMPKCLGSEVS